MKVKTGKLLELAEFKQNLWRYYRGEDGNVVKISVSGIKKNKKVGKEEERKKSNHWPLIHNS